MLVLNVNYRGSNGRGEAYQRAIFADWGNKEVVDLLAGVDYVVAFGDRRSGSPGHWRLELRRHSHRLHDRDDEALQGGDLGGGQRTAARRCTASDEYIYQYDNELGAPWKSQDLWIKLSYPFFHADRISTPTLFMGGDKDFNVPVVGGEQMYQALRTLNVPTQLVVYPDQHHGLTRPSFNYDRLQRYVAWYDRFLKERSGTGRDEPSRMN